ncbi:MAG: 6,7-dimethyl-8-ribityllumazine synthase, partial [Candidatus Nanohaloarchaea archaeon]|nr:6,7-dimethyl-8-ribityllumazine synthase [Candidatus Nanohaloarchaea archaeon]
ARFNEEYTEEMLEAARERAEELGLEVETVVNVPGTHETPVAAEELLSREDIDGVVTLGAVIEGATDHDEVIAYNVSKQLLELSVEHGKPVGMGIIGPGVSWSQVEKRTEEYARRAVEAAAETFEELEQV